MQFELFERPTAIIEKKSGLNRSISNTTYYFLTSPLKADVLFEENRNWKNDHITSSK